MGRSDLFLILEVIKKVVGIAGILISMWFGVLWIAIVSVITTVMASFINAYPNKKLLGYSYWEQIKDILPAIGVSVLMGIPVYLMNYLPINSVVILVLQILAGMALYIAFSAIFKMDSFLFLWGVIKAGIGSRLKKKDASLNEEQEISAYSEGGASGQTDVNMKSIESEQSTGQPNASKIIETDDKS